MKKYFESIELSTNLKAIRTMALLKDFLWTEGPWTAVVLLWFDIDDNC